MKQEILLKPLVIVGLMGCGKSAIGKRLAQFLEVEFYDLDHEIESQLEMTVTEIFEKYGEAFFRAKECEVMSQLLDGKPCIISTGGGAYIQEPIRALVKNMGTSLWIRASFDILLERVSRKKTRPLLETGDKAAILKELIDKRYPIYELADITVDTSDAPHQEMVDKIIAKVENYAVS